MVHRSANELLKYLDTCTNMCASPDNLEVGPHPFEPSEEDLRGANCGTGNP